MRTESAIRRRAAAEGYKLVKSRRRNPTTFDLGEFMLIEVASNLPVVGYSYDAELSHIEEFLDGD